MSEVIDSDVEILPKTVEVESKSESNCTLPWLHSQSEGLVKAFSVDELPDGYATNVSYGERFHKHDYSALFHCYPVLICLIVLGVLVSLGGILFWIFHCMGKCCAQPKECANTVYTKRCSLIIGVLILLMVIFIFLATLIMLNANTRMSDVKAQRAESLRLADEQTRKIVDKMEATNNDVLLHKFDKFALQFEETARNKADSYLNRSTGFSDFDYAQYKADVQEVLEAFGNCSIYMLQFLDSWRYYNINATRFAKHVGTMESKKAIQILRRLKAEFERITEKLMRQYKIYYKYDKALENVSKNMRIVQGYETQQVTKLKGIVDHYLLDLNGEIKKIGSKLRNIAINLDVRMANMRDNTQNTFYIEFPNVLYGLGWFVCVVIFLILFCVILALPFSIWAKDIIGRYIGVYLLLIAATLIFIFYLLIVMVTVFYFLYGMVAHDGICRRNTHSRLTAPHADIYSDCMANRSIYEIAKSQRLIDDPDILVRTSNAALHTIDGLQQRIPSLPLLKLERHIARPIDQTDLEYIYAKMLQLAVYASKDIEAFGNVWHSNVRHVHRNKPELVCAHAIGVTMVDALRGQVSREIDRMYRSTWKVEEALQRLTEIENGGVIAAKLSNYAMTFSANLSRDLRDSYVAERERYRASIVRTVQGDTGRCAPMARLYSELRAPACDCLVPSMNTFWFGGFLVIFLLLPLLFLLLYLAHLARCYAVSKLDLRRYNFNQANKQRSVAARRFAITKQKGCGKDKWCPSAGRSPGFLDTRSGPKRAYTHPSENCAAVKRWPVFPGIASPTCTRSAIWNGYSEPEEPVNIGSLLPNVFVEGRTSPQSSYIQKFRKGHCRRMSAAEKHDETEPKSTTVPSCAKSLPRRHKHPRTRAQKARKKSSEELKVLYPPPRCTAKRESSATYFRHPAGEQTERTERRHALPLTKSQAKLSLGQRHRMHCRSKQRDYVQQRVRRHSAKDAEEQRRESEQPSTSKAAAATTAQRDKLILLSCPCGCGQHIKIIGNAQEIQRVKQAKTICIASKQTDKKRNLHGLASVTDLR